MAATLQAPGEHFPLDNTMGVMWIGVLTSAVLYGVSLGQTLYYYNRYPSDAWYLKWLVGILLIFDTLHLILVSHTVYHYTITHYYNFEALNFITWSVLAEALPTGSTGAMVQLFYVARIFRLSKRNYWISGIITLLVVATGACGIAWVVISLQLKTYDDLLKINPLTITINALSAAADVLIAVILCFLLFRSKTGFRRTDTMISRLITFTANTGLATSVCALASLISLVASPDTLIYALFYFCIGRLYTNSLLVALNARKSLAGSSAENSNHLQSIPMSPRTQNDSYISGRNINQNLSIKIETTRSAFIGDMKGDMKKGGVGFESDTDDRPHQDLV